MITKRLKAPDWFKAIWQDDVMKGRQYATDLLGRNYQWYKSAKPEAIQSAFEKLNRDQKKQYQIAVGYANLAKDYAFQRFRFDHNDDFAIRDAEELGYQEDKGYIISKAGMIDHMMKKVVGFAGKIFGQQNVKVEK